MGEYNGEERRNGDKKIAVLEERLRNFMVITDEFRGELNHKLDKIIDKVGNLPCRERIAWYKSMGSQQLFMWWVLAILLSSVVGSAWAGYSDRNEIMHKLDEFELATKNNARLIEKQIRVGFNGKP